MMCYKDKTFCQFYKECADGDTCPDALTPEVQRRAAELELYISLSDDRPECFIEKA